MVGAWVGRHNSLTYLFVSFLTVFAEFAGLLNKQAPLQAYIEWVDNIIERCVLEVCFRYYPILKLLITRDINPHNVKLM